MDQLKGISDSTRFSSFDPIKNNTPEQVSFKDTLKSVAMEVNRQLNEADQMSEEFALGKRNDLHEIMIATEKASISLSFLLQIRNKLLEAYQEIMRMGF